MRLGAVATFVVVVIFLAVILRAMPKATATESGVVQQHPWSDLPLRVLVATGLVFLLTAVAPHLGARVTGLLSPFSVFGGVLESSPIDISDRLMRKSVKKRADSVSRIRLFLSESPPLARCFRDSVYRLPMLRRRSCPSQ